MDWTSILSQTGWLSRTPAPFREAMLTRATIQRLEKGEPAYHLHDPPGGLWGIVSGEVEIELPGMEAEPSIAHFAMPGFWLGEATLIEPTPRRVGVRATRPSTLATISLADCHAILAAEPAYWRWIALLSTMHLDFAMSVAADLLLRDPHKRTAAMLLRLSGFRNGIFLEPFGVEIQLSHEKLGRLVNLSRNALGPILKKFVDQKLIHMDYRSIQITDHQGLSDVIGQ